MAFGAKTNERPGTRAQLKYVRMSASKARAVLDLIRGESVGSAYDILAMTERRAAEDITKLLDSAVANAEHNDEIPAEDLYVSACYADQGPTLKRFRPRARGRASSIHKQTCHITLIVSRYSPDEIERRRAIEEAKGSARRTAASPDRAARVAASRKDDDAVVDESAEGGEIETEATDAAGAEAEAVDNTEAVDTPEDGDAGDEAADEGAETDADENDTSGDDQESAEGEDD